MTTSKHCLQKVNVPSRCGSRLAMSCCPKPTSCVRCKNKSLRRTVDMSMVKCDVRIIYFVRLSA
eukprot:COSAG02_NODE_124_length_35047_cov_31.554179_42_plen_64_part_00